MSMTRHVLLIDDDDLIREITSLSLNAFAGHRVTEASSGERGVAAALADPPDAILLDVMMPGMDGPETLQRLRAEPTLRDVPVLFLTAKLRPEERARFERLGVRGVIAKPFDPVSLAGELDRLVGW